MPPEKIQEPSVLPKTQPSLWRPFVYAVISAVVGAALGFAVALVGLYFRIGMGDPSAIMSGPQVLGLFLFYISVLFALGFLWIGCSSVVNLFLFKRDRKFFGGYLFCSLIFFPVPAFYLWVFFNGGIQ